jgi:DNA polymerase III epsilon subunit-like protein
VAHATCDKSEQEISAAERERDEQMVQDEELIVRVVCPRDSNLPPGIMNAPTTPLLQTFEAAGARLRDFGDFSERWTALHRALDDARDDQYEEEAILHRIAEEALITAGLLAAGLQVEEVEFMRRIPSGNQESKRPKAMEPRLLSFYQAELADNVKRTSHNLLRAQRKQAQ